MTCITVAITKYISDEPQPGVVECELIDALGVRHLFVEKAPIVTADHIDANSEYPRDGMRACEIVEESYPNVVEVSTVRPWYVESTTEVMRFKVRRDQLRQC